MRKKTIKPLVIGCIKNYCPILEFSTEALILQKDKEIILINTAGVKILGGTAQDYFIGKNFLNFIHPEHKKAFKLRWNIVNTKNKELKVHEEILIRIDSKEIYTDISLSSFDFENDHIVLISFRDITDRKRFEKILINNEERFKSMIQNINGYIYHTRYHAGKVISIYHSPKCFQITGYTQEEYLNDPDLWIKMVYKNDKDYVSSFFENLKPKNSQNSIEHRIVHNNGSIRWISNTFTPQFNNRGKLIRMDGFIVDITEKKEYEKALQDQNIFLQNLIDAIPNPIFYKNKDGRFSGCNKAYEDYIGMSREKLIGKTSYDIIPRKSANFYQQMDSKLLRNPTNQQFELSVDYPDHSKHNVIINKAVYKDADGNLIGFVGVIQDVSKLKQIQSELQKTLEKLREMEVIINKSPVVVFLLRAEEGWPVEFVSGNIKQFGYKVKDFISGNFDFAEIIYEGDLKRVTSGMGRYIADDKKEFTQDYRIKTKSGEIRWVENRTWILKNKQEKITHYQGIVIDITTRKKVEQMLLESESRYRTLAENSYDLICELNDDSTFIYASPNSFELLGYKNNELIGRNIFEFVHIDDIPAVLNELKKDYGKATLRFKHKNGDWRWFESAGKRFRTVSGIIKGVIVSRDITERKHFEQQLIQTEKLMAVGEMAAMIAHEFRNALTSIKMILQLQIESPNLNKSEVKSFNVAINSIYHMENVVQQLLNFAHPAPMELHIEDLNSVLNEILPFIQMECNKKSINFIKKFDHSIPPILIHAPSIKEAVINLLLNASQAFQGKNKLRRRISIFTNKVLLNETLRDFDFRTNGTNSGNKKKSADKKEILLKKGTECILIEISDNGSGIEDSFFPRIFEPFFTTKEKGSGLGLPIVKRTVNAHGGIVVVESKKNHGTNFKLYFPIKK